MSHFPDSSSASSDRPRRVLVVDDEPTLRLGFAYALNNSTLRAETASNGSEALAKIHESDFDAILLDLRMPDIDGLAVIKHLRDEGNEVPVILCSAFVTLESAFSAMRHRVVDFLIKPVRPVELREAVSALLDPADDPLSRSLQAARSGDFEAAAGMIGEVSSPTTRERLWRQVFEMLARPTNGTSPDEVLPPNTLERIAFHVRES